MKIMKIMLIIVVQLIFITASLFAETSITEGEKIIVPIGQNGAGTVIAAMSRGVLGIIIASDAEYAIVLKHILGSREYASASSGAKIYFKPVALENKDTPNMGLTLTTSSSADFADWAKL